MTINKFFQQISTTSFSAGSLLVHYSSPNSDARKGSVTELQEYMQKNLTFPTGFGSYSTQYAAPSATGFNVTITDSSSTIDNTNVHLILTPVAGYAAGTITLPAKGTGINISIKDKQEVLVNCTQSVTTLTVDPNGAGAVIGAPTTLSANDFFRLKYDLTTDAWYRVG